MRRLTSWFLAAAFAVCTLAGAAALAEPTAATPAGAKAVAPRSAKAAAPEAVKAAAAPVDPFKDGAIEITGFVRETVRISDGPDPTNVRKILAATIVLPAFASAKPSEYNYRQVIDARGASYWVASSGLVLGAGLERPPASFLSSTCKTFAARGVSACSKPN